MPEIRVGEITVRLNDDETLDEIVAYGAYFHLEQMDDGAWWMAVRTPDGSEVHVDLVLVGTRSKTAKVDGFWRDETVDH